jgi:hypothetical protein
MNTKDFFERFEQAIRLVWKSPPPEASQQATGKPPEDPLPAPPSESPMRKVRPEDIRSAATLDETGGAMITRSLPGLDVTVMISPPRGDALWTLQGRLWLNPARDLGVRVALVQHENVLATATVGDGGRFKFQDIIVGEWALEFHLGSNEVVVLRGPAT